MQGEIAITWGCITLGTALVMTLVLDRDRLLQWVIVGGFFWGAYVLYSLCVR